MLPFRLTLWGATETPIKNREVQEFESSFQLRPKVERIMVTKTMAVIYGREISSWAEFINESCRLVVVKTARGGSRWQARPIDE